MGGGKNYDFPCELRGPAAILFISRDSCSEYRQTLSSLFLWSIAQLSRDILQNGVSHRFACVKPKC